MKWLAIIALVGCGRIGFDLAASESAGEGEDAAVCLDPPGGLIGYWPMDAADLAGSTVMDRSGAERHGTMMGTPLPTVGLGRVGDALDFTATTTSYVSIPALAVDSTPGAFTSVALWYWHPGPAVDEVLVYLPSTPGTDPPRYDLWLTDRLGDVSLCINTGDNDCWGVTDLGLVGRWVHVVALFANGRIDGGALYIDGLAAAVDCRFGGCDEVRTVQAPFELASNDATYAWRGLLDEVRFYGRALSPDEVRHLYTCAP